MVFNIINKLIVAKALPVLNTHIAPLLRTKVLPFLLPISLRIRGYGIESGNNNNNNNNNKNKNKNKRVINIISYIFLGIIIYLFMGDLKIFKFFQIFIFSIISFAISMFISDKFKLSKNKFIKILQKFVFISSVLALIDLILYLFDISIFNSVFCENDDEDNNTAPSLTAVREESIPAGSLAPLDSQL